MKLINENELDRIRFNSIVNESALSRMNQPKYNLYEVDNLVEEIDHIVSEGKQSEIVSLFYNTRNVPEQIGDWELRQNNKYFNNKIVNRIITAIPKSKRSAYYYETGCKTRLKIMGYTTEQANAYYRASWKKKYAWLDPVMLCVKDILDSHFPENLIDKINQQPDPRQFCLELGTPKNPFQCSETHFESVLMLAKDTIEILNEQRKTCSICNI